MTKHSAIGSRSMIPIFFNYSRSNEYKAKHIRANQLYYAISLGLLKIAEEIVDSESDQKAKTEAKVNFIGGLFGTPLQLASYKGYQTMVAKLLSREAKPNLETGIFGTPLQAAATAGELEICTLLIEHQADVNFQGGLLANPLQAALAKKSIDIVTLLSKIRSRFDETGSVLWTRVFNELGRDFYDTYMSIFITPQSLSGYPKMLTLNQLLLATVASYFQGKELPADVIREKKIGQRGKVDNFQLDFSPSISIGAIDQNIFSTRLEWRKSLMRGMRDTILNFSDFRQMSDMINRRLQFEDMHTFGFVHSRLPWIALLSISDVSIIKLRVPVILSNTGSKLW
jgi:hypothetical protein